MGAQAVALNPSKTRREGWVLTGAKARKDFTTRWKASWIVDGWPFTGKALGGSGRAGESEARDNAYASLKKTRETHVRRQRGDGLEPTNRACKATKDVRGRSILVQAPPVRSTRNEGGQHPRRTTRKVIRRAGDPTGPLPTTKGSARI